MDISIIASLVGLTITVLGIAISVGRAYQRLNDMSGIVNKLDLDVSSTIASVVADGNRITRLEAQYTQIIATLAEIKADVRLTAESRMMKK